MDDTSKIFFYFLIGHSPHSHSIFSFYILSEYENDEIYIWESKAKPSVNNSNVLSMLFVVIMAL